MPIKKFYRHLKISREFHICIYINNKFREEFFMAIFRFLHTEFWKDDYFLDLTPEDKYFYIYLLTNDRCTQCGIYSFGLKLAAVELGYHPDTVKTLLKRFVEYGKILYNQSTGEVMILNWYKYNINLKNKNSRICINTCLKKVKNKDFVKRFYDLCFKGYKNNLELVKELFQDIDLESDVDKENHEDFQVHEEIQCENTTIEEGSHYSKAQETANEAIIEHPSEETLEDKKQHTESIEDYHKEDSLEPVIEAFEKNFHMVTPLELERLMDWCKDMNPQVVIKAMERAVIHNKRTMAYLNGILRNWLDQGVTTLKDYEERIESGKKTQKKTKELKGPNEKLPQYRLIPMEYYEDEGDL